MRVTTYEKEINEHGFCIVQTVGVSMEPLLHNRYSSVVLKKIEAPLKVNDVVLFTRPVPEGKHYVLHRIVKVRANDFIIRGDNCTENEAVKREQIIGVMTGYFNGDNYVECATDSQYQHYMKTLNRRYAQRLCKSLIRRTAYKLKHCFQSPQKK